MLFRCKLTNTSKRKVGLSLFNKRKGIDNSLSKVLKSDLISSGNEHRHVVFLGPQIGQSLFMCEAII